MASRRNGRRRKFHLDQWGESPRPGSDLTISATLVVDPIDGWTLTIRTDEIGYPDPDVETVCGETGLDLYEELRGGSYNVSSDQFAQLLASHDEADGFFADMLQAIQEYEQECAVERARQAAAILEAELQWNEHPIVKSLRSRGYVVRANFNSGVPQPYWPSTEAQMIAREDKEGFPLLMQLGYKPCWDTAFRNGSRALLDVMMEQGDINERLRRPVYHNRCEYHYPITRAITAKYREAAERLLAAGCQTSGLRRASFSDALWDLPALCEANGLHDLAEQIRSGTGQA